jgi:hypothetical protein
MIKKKKKRQNSKQNGLKYKLSIKMNRKKSGINKIMNWKISIKKRTDKKQLSSIDWKY